MQGCMVQKGILTAWMVLAFLCLSSGMEADRPNRAFSGIRTLVIDAGHGGKDPGAVGKLYYEKNITLAVAKQLQRVLAQEMPEIRVVLTRETDEFIELHRRGQIAKEAGGNFFLSIHCNGMEDRSKAGTETYVLGTNPGQESYQRIITENQAILLEDNHEEVYDHFDPSSPEGFIFFSLLKNSYREESLRLADKIQHQFQSRLGRTNRGVKQAPFVVLYACGMPSLLTEIGFITNAEEEKFIGSEDGQIFIASAIYRAIKEYNLELQIPAYTGGED